MLCQILSCGSEIFAMIWNSCADYRRLKWFRCSKAALRSVEDERHFSLGYMNIIPPYGASRCNTSCYVQKVMKKLWMLVIKSSQFNFTHTTFKMFIREDAVHHSNGRFDPSQPLYTPLLFQGAPKCQESAQLWLTTLGYVLTLSWLF